MGTISFARGAPAPECLDASALAECARAAIAGDPSVLGYGPAGGYGPLRAWLGERHGVDASRIALTNGSLQGFFFYARTILAERPGRVLVEAPTYDRPLTLLADLGVDVEAVPQDEDGLDLDALEAALARAAPRSSTRSRRSRTRAAGRCRRSAGAGSSSSRAPTTCPCSRTTRTGSSATRATRRRCCTSSRAASW